MPVRLRPAWLVNGLLGAALVGGGLWVYSSFTPASASEERAGGNSRTVAVSRATVTRTVTAPGSVRSASTASASFGTSGTVTSISVAVGDKVKKGQTLATVDDKAAKRQLAAAEDDLDAAQDALDRAKDADADTSSAQAQVDQAANDVDTAADTVAGTVLKAPMAGTVTAVSGTLGGSSGGSSGGGASSSRTGSATTTTTTTGFVTIQDLGKLEVTASVPEADATALKAGQKATVTWNALPGTRADATLTAVDPTATSSGTGSGSSVTYGATFSLRSVPDGVRAGQTVEVSVVVGSAPNAVSVLTAALTGSGPRRTVTVDQNGQHLTRSVEVGIEGNGLTQVTSGLEEGDQVVVTVPTGGGATQNGNQPGGGLRFPGGGGFPGGPAGGGGFRGGAGGRQGAGR